MRTRRYATLVRIGWPSSLIVASLACSVPSEPGPTRDDSPIQTDAVVYRLRRVEGAYEATARATYVNRTDGPVHYSRCHPSYDGPIYGYRRTGPDSTRSLFTDMTWACVGGVPPGVIAPGERIEIAVRLGALDQSQMYPPLRPEEIVGRMRIWLSLCKPSTTESTDCTALSLEQRQSNAFDVRY